MTWKLTCEARAGQVLNATLSLVIETTVRVEFSTWGLAPPGLIYLLAAVLRLLFRGRKLGRKRYCDTPLKCSAAGAHATGAHTSTKTGTGNAESNPHGRATVRDQGSLLRPSRHPCWLVLQSRWSGEGG